MEDLELHAFRDDLVIVHPEFNGIVALDDTHGHGHPRFGRFECILDEVPEDAPHQCRIRGELRLQALSIRLDDDVFLPGHVVTAVEPDHVVDEAVGVDDQLFYREVARLRIDQRPLGLDLFDEL